MSTCIILVKVFIHKFDPKIENKNGFFAVG